MRFLLFLPPGQAAVDHDGDSGKPSAVSSSYSIRQIFLHLFGIIAVTDRMSCSVMQHTNASLPAKVKRKEVTANRSMHRDHEIDSNKSDRMSGLTSTMAHELRAKLRAFKRASVSGKKVVTSRNEHLSYPQTQDFLCSSWASSISFTWLIAVKCGSVCLNHHFWDLDEFHHQNGE
ncbi:hypothetical protein R1flu_007759 [Riccia fluitans]|uniref:Uncharacterized protein n=1 Tax=Riccia fluitans TaxID=41844 RepID=A0ABD1Z0N5_9MARC